MSNTTFHPCGAEITEASYEACVTELAQTQNFGEWAITCTEHDVFIETVAVRKATVDANSVGWGGDPLKVVNAYLPRTFQAERTGDVITIVGTDEAGWTLDGFVIPRLASAMIFATEVN